MAAACVEARAGELHVGDVTLPCLAPATLLVPQGVAGRWSFKTAASTGRQRGERLALHFGGVKSFLVLSFCRPDLPFCD